MRDRASKLAKEDAQIQRILKNRRIEIIKRRMEKVTYREIPALEIKMLPASI
jgi:hypothetical protein